MKSGYVSYWLRNTARRLRQEASFYDERAREIEAAEMDELKQIELILAAKKIENDSEKEVLS